MTTRSHRGIFAVSALSAGVLALSACGGGGFSNGSSSGSGGGGAGASGSGGSGGASSQSAGKTSSGQKLQLMIGSSGAAETNAVKAAVNAWGKKTGNTVSVIAASNLTQQLGQGFAATPPDVFYTDASLVGDYASAGNLYAYGDQVKSAGFQPSLVKAFTYKNKFYCAPKDDSTLALIINTTMWKAAGLTDKDIPKTWDQLAAVAKKLTKGNVTGLVIGNDINRSGAFMRQAGGWLVNSDGTKMTATDAGNLKGLQEVQKLMKAGVLKFNTDTKPSTGWGGEAFGKGVAAMTIEGNWIVGAMQSDYPKVKYQVAQLPAGPAGKGTLLFSNCWGIAAKSSHKADAVSLVKYLTTLKQQMAFAKAFGVMPSTVAGAKAYASAYPQFAAFAKGAAYGQGPVNLAGFTQVMSDFNAKIATLSKGGDPATILASLQKNGTAALNGD